MSTSKSTFYSAWKR